MGQWRSVEVETTTEAKHGGGTNLRAHAGSGCESAEEQKRGDECVHQHESWAAGAQAEDLYLGQAAVEHESSVSGGLSVDESSPAQSKPGSGAVHAAAGQHGSGSVSEQEQSAEQSASEYGSQILTSGGLDVRATSGVDNFGQQRPPDGESDTASASGSGQVSQAVSSGQSRLRQMQAEVQRVCSILADLLAELQQNR